MLQYTTLQLVPIGAVGLSFTGFTARGVALWRAASWVRHGAIALSPPRIGQRGRRAVAVLCWIGALAVNGYIVSVAIAKSALGVPSWW